MKTSKDIIIEIERLLSEYDKEVHKSMDNGLLKFNTVKTYLLHSNNFVRWCRDEFIPGDRNATR